MADRKDRLNEPVEYHEVSGGETADHREPMIVPHVEALDGVHPLKLNFRPEQFIGGHCVRDLSPSGIQRILNFLEILLELAEIQFLIGRPASERTGIGLYCRKIQVWGGRCAIWQWR
jgi:hypothetical protein